MLNILTNIKRSFIHMTNYNIYCYNIFENIFFIMNITKLYACTVMVKCLTSLNDRF